MLKNSQISIAVLLLVIHGSAVHLLIVEVFASFTNEEWLMRLAISNWRSVGGGCEVRVAVKLQHLCEITLRVVLSP